jgi:murein DD-endopeptidase MepM/ murein hydrolase activator NlpD
MEKLNLRKTMRRAAALLMAAAVCMSVCLIQPPAEAVTQADIDSLKKQANDLGSKKSQLKSKLNEIKTNQSTILEKKKLLDDQCDVIQQQIDNVSAQISDYSDLITAKESELADTEAKEEKQYALFCERVRAMEENGTVSYWEVIFKATDFSDLLSRLDFVNEIMTYDENVIQELRDLRQKITDDKAALESDKANLESAKSDLRDRESELSSQVDEASAMMEQLDAQSDEYAATLEQINDEEEAIQAEIVKKSRELAASAQHGTPSGTVSATTWTGSGGYIWPEAVSKKISSPFGTRSSPGGIGSTNHKGVDISGVGTRTQVLAAKSGTVIVSTYSSSYGNYVVVSHGSGNTTLYAHMSALKVSAGQYVKQGTVLGITGSTGHSTGAHLHFEVTEGGERVNPLQYLTGYIKCW